MKINFNSLSSLYWGTLAGTFCLLSTAPSAKALTFVLDFNEPTQANTIDVFSNPNTVGTFDVTAYGFAATDFNSVTNSVLDQVESHFYDIPTFSSDNRSPIPDGKQLNIDFEIGNIGTPPTSDSEYYFMQIGDFVSGPNGSSLGVAAGSAARTSSGVSNQYNVSQSAIDNKAFGSIFTNNINNLALGGAIPNNALKSGNLTYTTNAIAGTLSHEIGHTLSLLHINKANSVTPGGVPPLMGTGAIDLPNNDRVGDRAFSYSGFNAQVPDEAEPTQLQPIVDALGIDSNEAESTQLQPIANALGIDGDEAEGPNFGNFLPISDQAQFHVNQLVSAVGLRDTASVPFEFSPGMGLMLVSSTWGFVSYRKKLSAK